MTYTANQLTSFYVTRIFTERYFQTDILMYLFILLVYLIFILLMHHTFRIDTERQVVYQQHTGFALIIKYQPLTYVRKNPILVDVAVLDKLLCVIFVYLRFNLFM